MNTNKFWTLMESAGEEAGGDVEMHLECLASALAELPEADIISFHRLLSEQWVKAHSGELRAAAHVISGNCSDGRFLEFRGWLISKGRKTYEDAIADPDSLALVIEEDEECQVEGLQYVAGMAWAYKTGKDFIDFPAPKTAPPDEPTGRVWNDDELPGLLPKLWKRFRI